MSENYEFKFLANRESRQVAEGSHNLLVGRDTTIHLEICDCSGIESTTTELKAKPF